MIRGMSHHCELLTLRAEAAIMTGPGASSMGVEVGRIEGVSVIERVNVGIVVTVLVMFEVIVSVCV
jgi:hypothetical protein